MQIGRTDGLTQKLTDTEVSTTCKRPSRQAIPVRVFRPMPAVSQAQDIGNTVANSIVSNPAVEFHGSMGISVGYTIATNLSHNDVGNCTYGPISVGW